MHFVLYLLVFQVISQNLQAVLGCDIFMARWCYYEIRLHVPKPNAKQARLEFLSENEILFKASYHPKTERAGPKFRFAEIYQGKPRIPLGFVKATSYDHVDPQLNTFSYACGRYHGEISNLKFYEHRYDPGEAYRMVQADDVSSWIDLEMENDGSWSWIQNKQEVAWLSPQQKHPLYHADVLKSGSSIRERYPESIRWKLKAKPQVSPDLLICGFMSILHQRDHARKDQFDYEAISQLFYQIA